MHRKRCPNGHVFYCLRRHYRSRQRLPSCRTSIRHSTIWIQHLFCYFTVRFSQQYDSLWQDLQSPNATTDSFCGDQPHTNANTYAYHFQRQSSFYCDAYQFPTPDTVSTTARSTYSEYRSPYPSGYPTLKIGQLAQRR